jgi:hypothetical protein
MYRMGRLSSIQFVTSIFLKAMSHSVIFSRKGGLFYSIHDWLPKHARHSCLVTDRMAQVEQPPSWRQPTSSRKLFLLPHGQGTFFIAFDLSNCQRSFPCFKPALQYLPIRVCHPLSSLHLYTLLYTVLTTVHANNMSIKKVSAHKCRC